ncbi:MAG: elongation factor P hydroxylase [Pseudomonadales bacterium]
MIFNRLFAASNNTILEKGGDEPLYQPACVDRNQHRVVFRHDYFASALHEIAHWCIAGTKRHKQIDYGYWYAPDGRTPHQQRSFEQVEVKPQALEWIFSEAACFKFAVSNDNLAAGETSNYAFERAVYQHVLKYGEQGLPPRAESFRLALVQFYGTNATLDVSRFGPAQCR